MLIIVICWLMEKKSLNLKVTIKMSTFQLNFVLEVYPMDLVILENNTNNTRFGNTSNTRF